jgi:hypothetical protein
MTLKLVHDDSVVVEMDEYANIAAMARKFADDVEAGEHPGLRTATILLEAGGYLTTVHWGHCPNRFEGIGMFEIAKTQIIADAFDDS